MEVGTDFDRIVRSANCNTIVAETEPAVADRMATDPREHPALPNIDDGTRVRARLIPDRLARHH